MLKRSAVSKKQTYLVDGQDLAVALLNLLQLPQEVPAHSQQQYVNRRPASKMGKNNPSTRKPEGIAHIDGGSPELALGADLVGGPELHAVDLGVLIAGRRQRAPHHLVLMELHTCESRQRIKPMDQILITEVRETKREKTHPEGHHFR